MLVAMEKEWKDIERNKEIHKISVITSKMFFQLGKSQKEKGRSKCYIRRFWVWKKPLAKGKYTCSIDATTFANKENLDHIFAWEMIGEKA